MSLRPGSRIIRVRTPLLGAIVVALALLVSCSRAPATHVVVMSGTRFSPGADTIRAGDDVEWKNEDLVPHTATANDRSFDSGNLDVDRAWHFKFRSAGTYAYQCLYHPGMVGTLVVR